MFSQEDQFLSSQSIGPVSEDELFDSCSESTSESHSSTTSSAQTPQFSPLSSDISLLANEDTVEGGVLTSQSNLHSTTEGMESCGKNIWR